MFLCFVIFYRLITIFLIIGRYTGYSLKVFRNKCPNTFTSLCFINTILALWNNYAENVCDIYRCKIYVI